MAARLQVKDHIVSCHVYPRPNVQSNTCNYHYVYNQVKFFDFRPIFDGNLFLDMVSKILYFYSKTLLTYLNDVHNISYPIYMENTLEDFNPFCLSNTHRDLYRSF